MCRFYSVFAILSYKSPLDREPHATQKVTLTTGTKGASIYYTLDGSNPTGANAILYKDAITIEDAAVLKFYAKADCPG